MDRFDLQYRFGDRTQREKVTGRGMMADALVLEVDGRSFLRKLPVGAVLDDVVAVTPPFRPTRPTHGAPSEFPATSEDHGRCRVTEANGDAGRWFVTLTKHRPTGAMMRISCQDCHGTLHWRQLDHAGADLPEKSALPEVPFIACPCEGTTRTTQIDNGLNSRVF